MALNSRGLVEAPLLQSRSRLCLPVPLANLGLIKSLCAASARICSMRTERQMMGGLIESHDIALPDLDLRVRSTAPKRIPQYQMKTVPIGSAVPIDTQSSGCREAVVTLGCRTRIWQKYAVVMAIGNQGRWSGKGAKPSMNCQSRASAGLIEFGPIVRAFVAGLQELQRHIG
jgi:hypothetical protein